MMAEYWLPYFLPLCTMGTKISIAGVRRIRENTRKALGTATS